jgi:hypothetical protein
MDNRHAGLAVFVYSTEGKLGVYPIHWDGGVATDRTGFRER